MCPGAASGAIYPSNMLYNYNQFKLDKRGPREERGFQDERDVGSIAVSKTRQEPMRESRMACLIMSPRLRRQHSLCSDSTSETSGIKDLSYQRPTAASSLQVVELTHDSRCFLGRRFRHFDRDRRGALSPSQLDDVFSTAPCRYHYVITCGITSSQFSYRNHNLIALLGGRHLLHCPLQV